MPAPGWRGLCNATRRIRTNGANARAGLGEGTPQQGWLSEQQNFQALKICGHRSILAFALSVQHWKFQKSNRNARWKFCRAKRVKRQSPCSWSPFTPNAVPAPVLQRRCPARPQKVWGHGAVSRSDGLCKIQGTVWRKPGAVRTLQPASFKHKNNTLKLYRQQLKTNFGRLNNYIRFYLWKRKIPPTQRSDDFVGWIGGKMNRVCCGAVNSFEDFPSLKWWVSRW